MALWGNVSWGLGHSCRLPAERPSVGVVSDPYGGSRRGLDSLGPGYKMDNVDASRLLRLPKSISRKNAEIWVGIDPMGRELATDLLRAREAPGRKKTIKERSEKR